MMGILGAFLGRRGRDRYIAAREKGATAEQKVLASLNRASRPWWIEHVRQARTGEDHSGIDVVVGTPLGPLFLQVKSSATGALKWRERHARDVRPIAVIIVTPADDLNTVYGRALGALILLREQQEACPTTGRRP